MVCVVVKVGVKRSLLKDSFGIVSCSMQMWLSHKRWFISDQIVPSVQLDSSEEEFASTGDVQAPDLPEVGCSRHRRLNRETFEAEPGP